MSEKKAAPKAPLPKLVTLGNALKLAEKWVNNMSQAEEDEDESFEGELLEGRPSRLGVGAKVPLRSKVGPSNDPVERRLHAKIDVRKRKVAQNIEEIASARNSCNDDEEEDEDLESRSKAFSKKRKPSPDLIFAHTKLKP